MNSPSRSLASSALLLGAMAAGLAGQAAAPRLAPLLAEEREIALARSAAPPQVSADADVYVLRRGGHVKAVSGSSGVACIVARDHPESVYPICYNDEGARTVLRTEIRRQQLREQGWTEERVEAEIDRALDAGELRAPQAPAMAWMISPQQVIYAGAAGPRVGQWHPHMMIYMPGATERALGLVEMPGADVFLVDAGKATAHLIVKTPAWSDGARDGG
jgi:hypothetical protein